MVWCVLVRLSTVSGILQHFWKSSSLSYKELDEKINISSIYTLVSYKTMCSIALYNCLLFFLILVPVRVQ